MTLYFDGKPIADSIIKNCKFAFNSTTCPKAKAVLTGLNSCYTLLHNITEVQQFNVTRPGFMQSFQFKYDIQQNDYTKIAWSQAAGIRVRKVYTKQNVRFTKHIIQLCSGELYAQRFIHIYFRQFHEDISSIIGTVEMCRDVFSSTMGERSS